MQVDYIVQVLSDPLVMYTIANISSVGVQLTAELAAKAKFFRLKKIILDFLEDDNGKSEVIVVNSLKKSDSFCLATDFLQSSIFSFPFPYFCIFLLTESS